MESLDNANSENLAHWLCEQKAISKFQAHILLTDCPGPFKFGNYLIVDRRNGIQFLGRHTTTGHPVLIDFVAGSEPAALQRWQQIRAAADSLAKSPHPNLLRIFESVAIPQYRFVVSEIPDGQPLLERIPLKTRLPWKKANQIVGQAASVMTHLYDLNLDRIRFFPDSLWITSSGQLRFSFPFDVAAFSIESDSRSINDTAVGPETNCNDLGALWYRMLTGRTLDSDQVAKVMSIPDIKRLQKLEIPAETVWLIQSMFESENSDRPDVKTIVEHCRRIAPWDELSSASQKTATLVDYESWLERSPESIRANSSAVVDSNDFPFGNCPSPSSKTADGDFDLSIVGSTNLNSSTTDLHQSRKSGYSLAAAVAGSVLTIGTLTAIVIALTINRPNGMASSEIVTDRILTERLRMEPHESAVESVLATELVDDNNSEVKAGFDQILIDDDGQSLWETPTLGPPISFRFVPMAPKLAFVVRPAELFRLAEGQRLIFALGPEMNDQIERWQQQIGMKLDNIAQIKITLHTSDDFYYDPFFLIETVRKLTAEELLQAWGNPELIDTGGGNTFYTHGPELAYRFVDSSAGGVTCFAVGPQSLIEESLQLDGADPLAGSMKMLASWSDNDRHVSLLFLRSGLFDDAGQKLMSGAMTRLNRALSLAIDNNVRGGMLGLHLDQGTYIELRIDRTDDLKAIELERSTAKRLQRLPTVATELANSLTASNYWSDTKNRFAAMIADFTRGWRIGSEDKRFIANCWLPETAAHNLVASMELMLAFADQRNPDDHIELPSIPQNLEALLAAPRDLTVSTSPDLTILISNLEQEIRAEYPELPFEFEIRLLGNDLSKEGITQNQRPGNFEIKHQPLRAILTEIMVRANPNKNITGADDLNCMLVWVVAADPDDASRQIILVTTRSAAAEKSYQLPQAFIAD